VSITPVESQQTNTIQIVLNGEPRAVPDGLTVDRLLSLLGMDSSRVAVELNRCIVRKPEWSEAKVPEGAQLEIVWFVGGG